MLAEYVPPPGGVGSVITIGSSFAPKRQPWVKSWPCTGAGAAGAPASPRLPPTRLAKAEPPPPSDDRSPPPRPRRPRARTRSTLRTPRTQTLGRHSPHRGYECSQGRDFALPSTADTRASHPHRTTLAPPASHPPRTAPGKLATTGACPPASRSERPQQGLRALGSLRAFNYFASAGINVS